MKKICVTGASGFVGSSICKTLGLLEKPTIGFVRKLYPFLQNNKVEYVSIGDICLDINWKDHFYGNDFIIHCAGIAHNSNRNDNQDIYRQTNVESTKRIAEHAVEAGIKRLIFLSSVKVYGESKLSDSNRKIISINDTPNPQDAYAKSKFEAENILLEISAKTNLEVVIIRLPLVYGHGVKGNLAKLINIIRSGIPLPFSQVKNQRSMIGIDNLVDMIQVCIEHPNAAGKIFLVSDDNDLSTRQLIEYISSSMGNSANLFPIPISILKLVGRLTGKESEIHRLIGSLQVDIGQTCKILNWKPTISVEEGIKRMII